LKWVEDSFAFLNAPVTNDAQPHAESNAVHVENTAIHHTNRHARHLNS
jgi:hypothetical protein